MPVGIRLLKVTGAPHWPGAAVVVIVDAVIVGASVAARLDGEGERGPGGVGAEEEVVGGAGGDVELQRSAGRAHDLGQGVRCGRGGRT